MSDTPRTDAEEKRFILEENLDDVAFVPSKFTRQLERELTAANERIKRLENALNLVAKMRADWLEMQDEGYSGAYYAFVKNLNDEWDVVMKAKESK